MAVCANERKKKASEGSIECICFYGRGDRTHLGQFRFFPHISHPLSGKNKIFCKNTRNYFLCEKPPEKIEKRFNSIKRRPTCSGKMLKFCMLTERNWINSNTWPQKTGACLGKMTGQITTSKVGTTESTKEKTVLSTCSILLIISTMRRLLLACRQNLWIVAKTSEEETRLAKNYRMLLLDYGTSTPMMTSHKMYCWKMLPPYTITTIRPAITVKLWKIQKVMSLQIRFTFSFYEFLVWLLAHLSAMSLQIRFIYLFLGSNQSKTWPEDHYLSGPFTCITGP